MERGNEKRSKCVIFPLSFFPHYLGFVNFLSHPLVPSGVQSCKASKEIEIAEILFQIVFVQEMNEFTANPGDFCAERHVN